MDNTSGLISKSRRGCVNWIESDSDTQEEQSRSPTKAVPQATPHISPAKISPSTDTRTCSAFSLPTSPITIDSDTEGNPNPIQYCSSTPCEPAKGSGCNSSWSISEASENVIVFVHDSQQSPWNSQDEHSMVEADTSTPGYKRGCHKQETDLTDAQLWERILREGMRYKVPSWMRRRKCSVHILAHNHFMEWPVGDQFCQLTLYPHLPIVQWQSKLKRHQIMLRAHTVVLYLQKLRNIEHITPLCNRISLLCRAIRSVSDARIFLCDTIPAISTLENQQIIRYNHDLFIATQHVNRELERVYYLSLHAHLYSQGEMVQPPEKYFNPNGDLTALGCLTVRSCIIREVGVSGYTL